MRAQDRLICDVMTCGHDDFFSFNIILVYSRDPTKSIPILAGNPEGKIRQTHNNGHIK